MAIRRPVAPDVTRLYRLTVLRSEQVSPSFQRVTVTSNDLADFTHLGFDHWFRLFVPLPGQTVWRLPVATSPLWYAQWLATPAKERPHSANYTVGDYRPHTRELDIDVVLHRGPDGTLQGRVARWAAAAQAGDPLAILDQGLLFRPPEDADSVLLVGDESAMACIVGILRSLSPTTVGYAVIEVPVRADVRDLAHPPSVNLNWVIRSETDPSAVPGTAALGVLGKQPAPSSRAYAYLVGESGLATGARRQLVQAGLGKDRVTFCGFWKSPVRRRVPIPVD